VSDLEPTLRFSDRAEEYARYRPTYPSAAIDAILEDLGPPSRLAAADVGAGTGISARLLAKRGVQVHAVEPNEAMRGAAALHPRVQWHAGPAEQTGLPAASVDLVLCAQAFHWFRPTEALEEFLRILRPRGRVALLWNKRDEEDPVSSRYSRLLVNAAGGDPVRFEHVRPEPLEADWRFTGFRWLQFRHAQELDLAGLLGRALSASYCPRTGPAWDRLREQLTELHGQHADVRGIVRLEQIAHLLLAERA
jgi:SAM-dependent methyltransferase